MEIPKNITKKPQELKEIDKDKSAEDNRQTETTDNTSPLRDSVKTEMADNMGLLKEHLETDNVGDGGDFGKFEKIPDETAHLVDDSFIPGLSYKPKSKFMLEAKTLLVLTLSAALIAFNLKSFVRAGGLFPGGFSGTTVLLQQICLKYLNLNVSFSFFYLPLNLIPAYMGFKYIGKKFTFYSFYVVGLSSILTDLLPPITITYDPLLVAIFGGMINALAITISLSVGASGGGTDFISIYMSEKKGIDAWNYIFAANFVMLTTAGILFGFDKALYSIIYQFTSTQVLNTLYQRYQKATLLIVTCKPLKVYKKIRLLTHHDATLISGIGCFEGNEKQILYSVIGRSQVGKVVIAIKEVDPRAFINVINTERLNGRFYRPPTS